MENQLLGHQYLLPWCGSTSEEGSTDGSSFRLAPFESCPLFLSLISLESIFDIPDILLGVHACEGISVPPAVEELVHGILNFLVIISFYFFPDGN